MVDNLGLFELLGSLRSPPLEHFRNLDPLEHDFQHIHTEYLYTIQGLYWRGQNSWLEGQNGGRGTISPSVYFKSGPANDEVKLFLNKSFG